MSRRFGRNQRRAMRATIAAQAAAVEAAKKEAADALDLAYRVRARLDRWATDICHLMGPDSAFNERVATQMVHDDVFRGTRLNVDPHRRLPSASRLNTEAMLSMAKYHPIALAIQRLQISRDVYAQQLRVRLISEKGDVAYALPDVRARRMSPRDIELLSETIAHGMASFLEGVEQA